MIIIGVLAAIAIPIFLNQRARANESACRSDVRNGAAAAQACAADQPGGSYASLSATAIQANPYNWNLSRNADTPAASGTATGYTVSVSCDGTPTGDNVTYTFNSDTGTVSP